MPPRGYDSASGQMYTETVVSGFSRTKPPSWVLESPFLPAGWEDGSPVGAKSLKHMAMRQCILDQRRLTSDHFAGVPWHIAQYIWDALDRSRKRTMYIWKVFATAYPREFRELSQYHYMQLCEKVMPIPDYLPLLRSDGLSWGTALTLSTEFTRVADLVRVYSVVNLVALEISYFKPPKPASVTEDQQITTLNDRIIRSWSEQAQNGGAFKHLRVLMIHGQHNLSENIFRYLDTFPSLLVFVVAGCTELLSGEAKKAAEKYGWAESDRWPCAEHLPAKYPSLSECKTVYDIYSNCFVFANNDMDSDTRYHFESDAPILDFTLEPSKRHRQFKKIWCFRQNPLRPTNAPPETKKRKMEAKDPRNASVKRRGGRDISGLLADFYR